MLWRESKYGNMAAVTTNLQIVIREIKSNFEKLFNKEYLLRPLAIEVIPLMKERIHVDGVSSDGSPIGEYSNGYMAARAKAGRGESRKVIVALTSELERDWQPIATDNGYGIGFNNILNVKKARWVEEAKGTIIFNLSSDEKKYISERIDELIKGQLG